MKWFKKNLFFISVIIGILMAIGGVLMSIYGQSMSPYTDSSAYYKSRDKIIYEYTPEIDSQKLSNRFYENKHKYSTGKYFFEDGGIGVSILGLILMIASFISKKVWERRKVINGAWLIIILVTSAFLTLLAIAARLEQDLGRGQFPWWADSIAIPIFGATVGLFVYGLVASIILALVIRYNYDSGTKPKTSIRNLSIVAKIYFVISTAFALIGLFPPYYDNVISSGGVLLLNYLLFLGLKRKIKTKNYIRTHTVNNKGNSRSSDKVDIKVISDSHFDTTTKALRLATKYIEEHREEYESVNNIRVSTKDSPEESVSKASFCLKNKKGKL